VFGGSVVLGNRNSVCLNVVLFSEDETVCL
jgi:hypothetical protein